VTIEQLARLYRVRLIDYERPGKGLLVSSGCGIMMGVMDHVPALRWCVDIDSCRDARIGDFMTAATRYASPLGVCGWFSLTDPTELREAIRAVPEVVATYAGHIRLGVPGEVTTLAAFIAALNGHSETSGTSRAWAR
jgi:hypothetical protein